MMHQLVIDTATEALSVALFTGGALTAFHHEIAGRGHAEKLLPVIAAMPDGGRAEEILADNGPGSFTGVRVGLAAARALSYAWGARLRSYSSLSMIAAMAREMDNTKEDQIAVVMTGGHGELFWQIFDRASLAPLTDATSTPIGRLAEDLTISTVYGTGAPALVEARGDGQAFLLHPDASRLPLLPDSLRHEDMAPLYGRGADATPMTARKGQ